RLPRERAGRRPPRDRWARRACPRALRRRPALGPPLRLPQPARRPGEDPLLGPLGLLAPPEAARAGSLSLPLWRWRAGRGRGRRARARPRRDRTRRGEAPQAFHARGANDAIDVGGAAMMRKRSATTA